MLVVASQNLDQVDLDAPIELHVWGFSQLSSTSTWLLIGLRYRWCNFAISHILAGRIDRCPRLPPGLHFCTAMNSVRLLMPLSSDQHDHSVINHCLTGHDAHHSRHWNFGEQYKIYESYRCSGWYPALSQLSAYKPMTDRILSLLRTPLEIPIFWRAVQNLWISPCLRLVSCFILNYLLTANGQ